jgi:hypothetical protein
MADKFIGGVTLRCATCELPFARVQNGVLIVESRHHGQIHVNTIPIAALMQHHAQLTESEKVNGSD